MKAKSTAKRSSRKASIDRPPKPYPDFPLSAANCGSWQKKINGRIHYFGKWGRVVNGKLTRIEGDGWQAALERYEQERDALYAGRKPKPRTPNGLTLGELRGRYLTSKSRSVDAGELTFRSYREVKATADRIVSQFGEERIVDDLTPEDFEQLKHAVAMRWGPTRLANEIQRVRGVFKWAFDSGLIPTPIRFGPGFVRPPARVFRKLRASNGKRTFEPEEIRKLLKAADPQLRAMILLGINCGYGNSDCASLHRSALDLTNGWLDFPRPKTGIPRRCKLWKETIDALKAVRDVRPVAKETRDQGLVFITRIGNPWVRLSGEKRTPVDSIAREFGALLKETGLAKPGRAFYGLRHCFRTVADATRDFPAARLIMGHADPSAIDATYRESIDDSRLEAVALYVHDWLFPPKQKSAQVESATMSDNERKGGEA